VTAVMSHTSVCVRVSSQDMNITPPSVACQNWSQCIHWEECADWIMTGANWLAERQRWPKGIASQFLQDSKQTSHWTDTQAHREGLRCACLYKYLFNIHGVICVSVSALGFTLQACQDLCVWVCLPYTRLRQSQ